jgi:hypothetical protein
MVQKKAPKGAQREQEEARGRETGEGHERGITFQKTVLFKIFLVF